MTICVNNRMLVFDNGDQVNNLLGQIVIDQWLKIPTVYQNVFLSEYVLMSNHFHGIISLGSNPNYNNIPTDLFKIIATFKTITSKKLKKLITPNDNQSINILSNSQSNSIKLLFENFGGFWQKSYYDHIIRSEEDLDRIKEYIINNPANWDKDTNNPLVKESCTILDL